MGTVQIVVKVNTLAAARTPIIDDFSKPQLGDSSVAFRLTGLEETVNQKTLEARETGAISGRSKARYKVKKTKGEKE